MSSQLNELSPKNNLFEVVEAPIYREVKMVRSQKGNKDLIIGVDRGTEIDSVVRVFNANYEFREINSVKENDEIEVGPGMSSGDFLLRIGPGEAGELPEVSVEGSNPSHIFFLEDDQKCIDNLVDVGNFRPERAYIQWVNPKRTPKVGEEYTAILSLRVPEARVGRWYSSGEQFFIHASEVDQVRVRCPFRYAIPICSHTQKVSFERLPIFVRNRRRGESQRADFLPDVFEITDDEISSKFTEHLQGAVVQATASGDLSDKNLLLIPLYEKFQFEIFTQLRDQWETVKAHIAFRLGSKKKPNLLTAKIIGMAVSGKTIRDIVDYLCWHLHCEHCNEWFLAKDDRLQERIIDRAENAKHRTLRDCGEICKNCGTGLTAYFRLEDQIAFILYRQ